MRVRLPEELCGATYDAVTVGDVAHVDVPGVGRVVLPVASLTEVKPELPPEPPVDSVVRVGGWGGWVLDRHEEGKWYTTGDEFPWSWEKVCAKGTPVLLVEPPEPVTLPWTSNGVQVQQTTDDGRPGMNVFVSTKTASYGYAHLKPADAREMARALWTAADLAEAQATP